MLIPFLGKLSVAQAITAADEISENVMQVAAEDYANLTDLWWIVDVNVIAAGDSADTFDFSLVIATAAGLGTAKEVCAVRITGIADVRLATAGRHIVALNVGKMMKDMLDTDGSDNPFIGMKNTLSAGATVTIDAVLSTTPPATEYHRQVTGPGITSAPTNP